MIVMYRPRHGGLQDGEFTFGRAPRAQLLAEDNGMSTNPPAGSESA